MSYVPVPASGASIPATDGPQILANFQSIQSAWDVNHVDFNTSGAGKHNLITFPVQSSAPSFIAGEVGLYNLNSTLTSANELFLVNSIGTTIPLTASDPSTTGWCYLPSGLLLKWGVNAGSGSTIITFPTAADIPVFGTEVIMAQVTNTYNSATDVNTAVTLSSYNTTSITVYCSARTVTGAATTSFTWLVMGY